MEEKRRVQRQRRLKEGRIVFNGRKSVMSCLIRDLSETGAKLRCGEPYLVPPRFELLVTGAGEHRASERVWIRQGEMGIRFLA
jgi:hypothetical protein